MPNISETLAKAREAGMSYGQYVALHDTEPPVKISEQEKREQKIIDLYNKNYTLQAIQHAMHMSQDSIKAVLDKNQIERRSRTNWINSAFEENRSEIEQLCKEGKSISFIANKFGFSFGTLKKRLDKEGIKRARPYKFNITKEELKKTSKRPNPSGSSPNHRLLRPSNQQICNTIWLAKTQKPKTKNSKIGGTYEHRNFNRQTDKRPRTAIQPAESKSNRHILHRR